MRRIQGGVRGVGAVVIGGLLCAASSATSLRGSELDARRADAQPTQAALTSPPIASDECAYANSWLAPRSGARRHLGVDIIAALGTPVVAVVDGTISRQRFDRPGSMSGNQLNVRSNLDATYYMYLHLDRFTDDVGLGLPVTAGQVIGYVGSTGATSVAHLHFEVHPLGGTAVDPLPYVDAAQTCKTPEYSQSMPTTVAAGSTPTPPPAAPSSSTAAPVNPVATNPPAPPVIVQPAPVASVPPATLAPSPGISGIPVVMTGTFQPAEVLTVQVSGVPGLPPVDSMVDVSISLTSDSYGRATAWACSSGSAQYGVSLTVGPGTATTRLALSPTDGNICVSADVPASYVVAVNGQL
jgi:Peptidase family M23